MQILQIMYNKCVEKKNYSLFRTPDRAVTLQTCNGLAYWEVYALTSKSFPIHDPSTILLFDAMQSSYWHIVKYNIEKKI
jgi:hypothetical protein